jgi:adenine specific DNA methylase Mod
MNKLYFGDNLDVLREKVKDESVDLVYLDPPFNSDANYNVLFKQGDEPSQAQAEAFRDTWDWGDSAAFAYDEVIRANGDVGLVLSGFRKWLGENAMMAYLAMMTVRLLELRRVLQSDGSIYLHCDPKASHYLKLILDAIFGHRAFRNEIIWKRTTAHSDTKNRFSHETDTLLFYANSEKQIWNTQYGAHKESYLESHYRHVDKDGRHYRHDNIIRSKSMGLRPNLTYEYNGFTPPFGWRVKREKLEVVDKSGRLYWSAGGIPYLIRYLDEQFGEIVGNLWDDIPPVNSQAQERIGYPTQKPLALLERIIKASSNEEMVILDPFCGCGTTVEAAERFKRQWIGIDVTHYAITLIERRLAGTHVDPTTYQVVGRPTDLAGARDLARRDKHQFQWWAAWRLGARWYREEKKGADRGIDGRMMFKNGPYGDGLIIMSVKGGENIGVQMVRDLRGVIERDEAEMGILVCLAEPTGPMKTEAAAAGFVSKSAHGRLPRLQIITIEEMLNGLMPKLPPLPQPERIDRMAPRKKFKDQLELLLPFAGDKVAPAAGDFVDPSIMAIG